MVLHECVQTTIFLKHWQFFDELTISLSKTVNKFDSLIIMGEFNRDITKENFSGFDKVKKLVVRLLSQT